MSMWQKPETLRSSLTATIWITHSDRFKDYSLLFFKKGKLHSILPAHEMDKLSAPTFGLTYGGLIMNNHRHRFQTSVQLFKELNVYPADYRVSRRYVYIPIPWIYHQIHPEEDLYAIFWICKARIVKRNIGSVLFLQEKPRWRRLHRRSPEEGTAGMELP